MALQHEEIAVGNHTIAVYSDTEMKIQDILDYLRKGMERNEALILITGDITKDEIRKRIRYEWSVDVAKLEADGDLLLRTPEEWYFKEGRPNWRRSGAMFLAMEEEAVKRGKAGVRGAGDTRAFFEKGYVSELVDYETSLERRFNISFTPMCTYSRKDFDTLTSEQVERLRECHYQFVMT